MIASVLTTIELSDSQVVAVIVALWLPLIGMIQWARALVHRVQRDSQEIVLVLVEQLQTAVENQVKFADGILARVDRLVAAQERLLKRREGDKE